MTNLLLQRTGSPTHYEVVADGEIVGRISLVNAVQNKPWMWSIDLASRRRAKPRCSPSRRPGSVIERLGWVSFACGAALEFTRALWALMLRSPASSGAFFAGQPGPGRQEGSACSVDEMDSGTGGTAQRDVHAVVRHIVRKRSLHVLACGGAAIEHGGHAWG